MIMKAIKDGVTEERIAAVLHINLKTLRQKRDPLVGICPEAADLLKDKDIWAGCFNVLRRMTALRQIEAAELMSTISNYSATLAKTILAASTTEQLAKPGARKAPRSLSPEQLAQLEQEMTSSQAGLAALKDTYGADRLELQVACRYLGTILGNARRMELRRVRTASSYPVEARMADSPTFITALLSPAPLVFAEISLPLHDFTMGRLPMTSAPSMTRACSGSRMVLSSTSLITAAPTASKVEKSSASMRLSRVLGKTGFRPDSAESAMRMELF
jgi:hypothetical protein